jgi:hypothetical protein
MVDKLKIGDSSIPRKSAVIATKVNELIDKVDSLTPGGGPGTVEYIDVANETKQLTKDDQYVRFKSDTSNSKAILPLATTINDGHFIDFFRGDGALSQVLESSDATISRINLSDNSTELNLPLSGNANDISINGVSSASVGVISYIGNDVNGKTHDVMRISTSETGKNGVSIASNPILGGSPRTIFFQYKSETGSPLDENKRFFGIGDRSVQGGFIGLTSIYSDSIRIDISGLAFTYFNLGTTINDGQWHSIALVVKSSTEPPELYVDDFTVPITIDSVDGGDVDINTERGKITVGHWVTSPGDSAQGLYSNFRIYDSILTNSELTDIVARGVFGAVDLATLDVDSSIRFIYDHSANLWQAQEAITDPDVSYKTIENTEAQLKKDDQHVILKSKESISSVTFPPASSITDGHFVMLTRGEGDKAQLIKSNDTPIATPPLVESPTVMKLLLDGNSTDTSPNATAMTETNVTFVEDTFEGQTHDVMNIASGLTGINGLTGSFSPVTGNSPRTIFFQFKGNGEQRAGDKAGFFGIGDISYTGAIFALEGDGSNGDLRLHFRNVLIKYQADKMQDLFDGNVHTIAITSASSSVNDVELYVDDMAKPVTKNSTSGGGAINTASGSVQIGWSKSANSCVPGRYSNFRIYDSILSTDDLKILKTQGINGASDLTALDVNEEVRFIYDASGPIWQSVDAKLYRLLEYNNRITSLENPPDSPRIRAVSNVAQSITTATDGVVIDFEVEKSSIGMSLIGGELEFLKSGTYNIQASLNLDTIGFSGGIETWVESYDNATSSWVPVDDSGQEKEFDSVNEGQIQYVENGIFIDAGTKLRLKIRGTTSGLTLAAGTLANGTAAPSAKLSVSKV